MPCNPTEFAELITVQARAAGRDSLGQSTGAWADAFQCWAKAEPMRGREYFAAGAMQSIVDVRFTTWWRGDITAGMRVIWRGEPYEVSGEPIDVKGQRMNLELMCVKGTADGR